MKNKIRVLVVDDTSFMRKALTRILESDPEIQVTGFAQNGEEALKKIKELKPDVVTLDIDMPVMDGITAIRHIMVESSVPIVAFSSLGSDGAITFEALRLGVVDFVPKPSGAVSLDVEKVRHRMIERVKMACSMNLENVRRVRLPEQWSKEKRISRLYRFYPLDFIVAMGTTLSGPNTVIRLLSRMPPTLPAAIVVVQEISPRILPSFVEKFDRTVPWKVKSAQDGLILDQGACYIASNEYTLNLTINKNGDPCLSIGEKSKKPLDSFFTSVSRIFRQNTIGILLTGVGDDGARGFKKIKKESGVTIVQDTKCCVFPNLADNAIKHGVVDMGLSEKKLPHTLKEIMH